MTDEARDAREEVARARRMLFGGHLTITITSPLGGSVKFRFSKLLDKDKKWDGRAWWLFRGSEYVGIVKRVGNALDLATTSRSTSDRMILKAAALTLASIRDGRAVDGYTIASADKCGVCGTKLEDPKSIALGIGPVCRGER